MITITDTGVKINDLNIDIPSGPIGISFSAGADSAILAYILMKYHPGRIDFFTILEAPTELAQAATCNVIIDKICKLIGRSKKNIRQHICYIEETKTNEIVAEYLKEHAKIFNINVVYTGITQAPPDTNNLRLHQVNLRNPKIKKEPYRQNGLIYHPFINIDKKDIKKLYDIFELTENLFPYTNSCYPNFRFSDTTNVDIDNIIFSHCGNCWWCEERKWGFGQL